MRVRAEQLNAHIDRNGLAPVYLLSGDEPLQMTEAADEIRRHARDQGFAERTVLQVARGFDWSSLQQESANLSLFSTRRILDLRLDGHKPGRDGAEALIACAESAGEDNLLLITCERLDRKSQQTRWYKAMDQAGVTIQIWPVEPARLPEWVAQRMRRRGKTLDRPAAELIAQRVEGNLLAAAQEIDKLALLIEGDTVSIEDVMGTVTDSARFEAFALVESCLAGNATRLVRMLRGLRQEGVEPLGVLGPVMWELRRLSGMVHGLATGQTRDRILADYHVWPQRRAAVNACLDRLDTAAVSGLLRQAAAVDRSAKGASFAGAWEQLESFLLAVSGKRPAFVNRSGGDM